MRVSALICIMMSGLTESWAACSFDGVAALRDADVVSSFDPVKMQGLWYEHGFSDPAQSGASCQTLNGTYNEETGTLNTDFSVKYGPIPFTIVEHYEPHDASMKGVYRKSVTAPGHLPGGHLLGLPTAIVKAKLSTDKSRYEMVVISSCLLLVDELVIATRSPAIADSDYMAIVDAITAQSVPASDKLSRVDWSKCKEPDTALIV